VVIERHGRAVAVVLSKEEYDELNEIKLQQLRAEIHQGLADLERGTYTDYEADELHKLAERIKAAGREGN
jgi:PHD/YefM family antitoxin component YafN of YafNO toxin-antitoxin module